jgi:GGDEF domain-containing protein
MIDSRDMSTAFNRALQIRAADRLRASLARDAISGLPLVGALSDLDQSELCAVGGGRLAAVVLHVAWSIAAVPHPRAVHEVHALVMNEVVRLVDEQVRRTDLFGSLRDDLLLILAPALDPLSSQSLAERLKDLLVDRQLALGDVHVQLRVKLGIATRSPSSPAGWTTQTLVAEAERNAADPPPIAIVA